MSDRWHILGVGSIGGLFAHRLKAGGAGVRLLSRDVTKSYRQLTLATKPDSEAHLFECESVEDTAEIEHLLITTKSWGAHDAIKRIQHRLTDRTVIVAMMNGMQHIDDLKPLISETQLFLASTTAGCRPLGTDTDPLTPPWLGCWPAGTGKTNYRHRY